MSLNIYNTQTRTKEPFVPLQFPQVKMYCCGPTVYDLLHVGNFRGAIFYNLVRNWLEYLNYNVVLVYNYTDVDDKIIHRAQHEGVSAIDLAKKYIEEFEKDFQRLNLRSHDLNPRVSETMPEIISLIQDLILKKKAYIATNGDVWYSVRSFENYGKLSNRKLDELFSSVRIEKDENKKDSLDFALWKSAKPDEPFWDSVWGPGRPGWHIECSAMAKKYLGEQIDIHGGGLDLMFPHHENEIAQSEGASGKTFAKYWVHNNMLNFGGSKMSKSLGNIMTGRAFMDKYHPEILKYLILISHYRSVTDFSELNVENAIKGLARIYSALAVAENIIFINNENTENKTIVDKSLKFENPVEDVEFKKACDQCWNLIEQNLNDDFATPEAFARIFDLVRLFNSQVQRGVLKKNSQIYLLNQSRAELFKKIIIKFGSFMSLFQEPAIQFLIELDDMLLKSMGVERSSVDSLVKERSLARENKNFKRADELRDQLIKMGISVQDSITGSSWEVTK